MHLLQVTIATTGASQPICPAAVVPDRIVPFQQIVFQNNGVNNMRLGDAGVTATRGIVIGPSGGANVAPQLAYTGDLSEFWVNGTAGDKLDILVLD